jgi:DNA polymerase-1
MPEITLIEAMEKSPSPCGFDFETTGLDWLHDPALFLGIGSPTFSGWIDIRKYSKETFGSFLRDFMSTHSLIGQNIKFDFHVAEQFIPIDSIPNLKFTCTMLISQIIDENASHGLDDMTSLWMGEERLVKKRAVDEYVKAHKLKTWLQVPPEIVAARGEEDAINTYDLYGILRPKLTETKVYALEKQVMMVLLRMERNGALLDREYLINLRKEVADLAEVIDKKYPDILLSSPQQVGRELAKLNLKFEAYNKPNKKTGERLPSTATEALELIEDPPEFIQDILEYRTLVHTISLYIDSFLNKMDERNIIHPNFKQMGARTGRMSCVNPNLQQLPKRGRLGKWIKSAFIGDITTFDYSQMEAILYAYDSKDERMIREVEARHDLYGWLAEILTNKKEYSKEERDVCKGLFLGTIYGMGKKKFRKMSQGLDPEGCKDFFGRLSQIQQDIDFQVQRKGYVETFIGRKRHLELFDSYKGLNARIQGSAADIVKQVLVSLPVSIQDKVITQVHDELVCIRLEPQEKALVEEAMCDVKPFKLRVEYGSGTNWWLASQSKDNK